jgi:hypothetical protein
MSLLPSLHLYLTKLYASYRIGNDPASLENMLSFDKANFSSFLDKGKHLASSLNRISLYNIYIMP